MLWLAVLLPDLALEIHTRSAMIDVPLAVAEAAGGRQRLLLCDVLARRSGVRPGMSPASAWALCAPLRIVPRDRPAERRALERVADWAGQFTSRISIADRTELLLEIGGSLRLFGGLEPLLLRLRHGLRELGYGARLACAPTPLAAQWLVRSRDPQPVLQADALPAALEQLPAGLLQLEPDAATALERFGIRTIGECLRLPRDSLAQRLGPHLLALLDRGLGILPDPRALHVPQPKFSHSLNLPAPTAHADALLFAARRLCIELCGFLAAAGQGAQRLEVTLRHERRQHTRFALELVAASRSSDHLLTVLRERLGTIQLPQPALAIRLNCTRHQALAPTSHALLPDQRAQLENAALLFDKIQARLGPAAICGLRLAADHRPERAWASCPPQNRHSSALTGMPETRPLWLLPQAQQLREDGTVPCLDGPLTLLAGPERIESGWWDGQPVARDYFIARNPAQAVVWIYRERDARARWFLHGLFA